MPQHPLSQRLIPATYHFGFRITKKILEFVSQKMNGKTEVKKIIRNIGTKRCQKMNGKTEEKKDHQKHRTSNISEKKFPRVIQEFYRRGGMVLLKIT